MGEAIGNILASAVGVAISPIPIAAVILMLFSPRARTTGIAFAIGWVLALLVVGSIAIAIADGSDVSSDDDASNAAAAFHLALGVLLLLLAARAWRGRPREGEEPKMPSWMSAIDQFTAVKAFGLGLLLAGINPKNLALTLAAGTSIAQAGLDGAEPWVVLGVFVALGSVSVVVPVAYYLLAGASAERTLNAVKSWLIANNTTVMAVLLLVLGAKLIGDGIAGLTD